MYALMMDCWHPDPARRLSATTILSRLQAVLQHPRQQQDLVDASDAKLHMRYL
jgi:hypothetical protein